MSLPGTIYTASLHLATLVGRSLTRLPPVFAGREGKLQLGIRGLLEGATQLEAWARKERDPSRPLVWFHASSVGEGLQARAVVEALRVRRPELQLVYTYFSPSAAPFAGRMPVDYAGHLPIDLPAPMARVLEAVRPAAIAFSKNEIWPNLVRAADDRDIPTLLLSATLPESSSRTRGAAAWLLREAHARLARLGAISPDDAKRYEQLGVSPARIFVMGDARFDQVRDRTLRVDPESPHLSLLRAEVGPRTLVAGSTWPPDEDVILQAAAGLRDSGDRLRLIVAPHEPSPAALKRFEAAAAALSIDTIRLADLEQSGFARIADRADVEPRIILIDRVGILGDLYALSDMAYVGGGFGTAGLHSVLEPAAFGVPIAFGPRHSNAREAGELVRRGGAGSVTSAGALESLLRGWLRDDDARRSAGRAAALYVEANIGAAARGAAAIIDVLGSLP